MVRHLLRDLDFHVEELLGYSLALGIEAKRSRPTYSEAVRQQEIDRMDTGQLVSDDRGGTEMSQMGADPVCGQFSENHGPEVGMTGPDPDIHIGPLVAVAFAELSLETAIGYARERSAFGRPVIKFQVWQHRFADLAVRIRTGKALTYRALRHHIASENGVEVPRDELVRLTSMAKLYTQRMAWNVADECVQVHGGVGALKEYPAQRYWRDARVGTIGGGTDDIMRNLIARTMGIGAT